jgi:hypothetical protein
MNEKETIKDETVLMAFARWIAPFHRRKDIEYEVVATPKMFMVFPLPKSYEKS